MTERKEAVRALVEKFDHFVSWLYTRRLYGPRCDEFADRCPVCEAWQFHDEAFNGASSRPLSEGNREADGE